MLCCAESLSRIQLFATPWTVALKAPLSMGTLQARTVERVIGSFTTALIRAYLALSYPGLKAPGGQECCFRAGLVQSLPDTALNIRDPSTAGA